MSALILLVLLLGGVWCLASALLCLYRYLASRRAGPAAPRLWREQRRRFLWSAGLGAALFAAFGVAAWWFGSGTPTIPPPRPGPLPQAEARGQVGAMPIPLPAVGFSSSQALESRREVPAASASAGSGESPAPPAAKAEANENRANGEGGTTADKAGEEASPGSEATDGSAEGPANPGPAPAQAGEAPAAIAPTAESTSRATTGSATDQVTEGGDAPAGPAESQQAADVPAQVDEAPVSAPAAESPNQAHTEPATDKASEGGGASPGPGGSPMETGAPPPPAPPREAEAAKRDAWTVCAASFRRESMAQNYAQRLARQGLAARVSRADLGEKGVWYRVCLGGFASLAEAKRQYQAWEEQGLISDAFLLPLR